MPGLFRLASQKSVDIFHLYTYNIAVDMCITSNMYVVLRLTGAGGTIPMASLKKHGAALSAVAAIALSYTFFLLLGISCPIKFITGVSCAGCGMTRAWLHVFRLDLNAAFHFHPLFWTIPIAVVFFFLRKRFPRLFRVTAGVITALFIAVYFVRIFDRGCDIVAFEPYNSVFYSIARNLTRLSKG